VKIAELALAIANNTLNGTQKATAQTATLLQILQRRTGYHQQSGLPLDPSLIRMEAA